MASETLMIKIILLGDGRVGKTSLANRFAKNIFRSDYQPTIGINFLIKQAVYQDQAVKILIFDTAGQEFLSSLRKQHYAAANGVVIVYDITNKQTFDDLDKWVNEIQEEVGDVKTVFVGNKVDLEDKRVVSAEEGKFYAQSVKSEYLESSAKDDIQVTDIFQSFIDDAIKANSDDKIVKM
ncbi:MAG: Transforming protein p29 precursor [Candidatus Heimdallarchaeota archaeon LC_2]|nr:MAG: Transforming protein p29 precursor [Candidatus Heimdallarchaeota archaeon LC_2]